MTNLDIRTRGDLPEEMQILLREHPRDSWPGNPDFTASIRNWMAAHQSFRKLSRITKNDTESFIEKEIPDETYVPRLAHFGNLLVRNLHGHHSWEDRSFFPELMRSDPRFEHGIDMLESDHAELDVVLDTFTTAANRLIMLEKLDPAQVREQAGCVHESASAISGFLDRHLTDEEELAVPILLHYKLRR